ncbi:MAG: hydrogenase maturation protease [Geopsychrobacter sp.]|nr:hydrogenase maturation protease [Geopsychrobacter sp.]
MWLIIGYGNPLRGDDGAGPIVAENLAEYFAQTQTTVQPQVISTHQLTPELALEIKAPQIKQVLFIDVKRHQEVATSISPLQPDACGSCGHQMTPQLLLQLSAQLYQRPRPGWLLTIAGHKFDFAERLSTSATAASESAFKQALEFTSPTPV